MKSRFTEEEKEKIKELYQQYGSGEKVAEIVGKNPDRVREYLKAEGLMKPRNFYGSLSYEECMEIGKLYQEDRVDDILAKYPDMTKQRIYTLCSKFNFKKESYFWSKEDEDVLKEYYNKVKSEELAEMLNYRHTPKAICTKAKKMGLGSNPFWTNEEDEILRKSYSFLCKEKVMSLIPNRSWDAIILHANKLGLTSYQYINEKYSDKQKQFILDNYEHMTDQEIADVLGKPLTGVQERRRRLGIYYFNKDYSNYYSFVELFRGHINDWKVKSIELCGYGCIFTGSKDFAIHHIHGFNLIANEAFEYLTNEKLLHSEKLSDYNKFELDYIINIFNSIHNKYPLGVCLRKDIHILFHNIYGAGSNTVTQWNRFVDDFKNGKYKEKIIV